VGGLFGVSGGVVGISFIFSMLGQGGGMIYMPLFHWVGYDIKTVAIPLGILLSATAKIFSLPQYQRQHLIDWRGAWPMMIAVLIGAPLGALVTGDVPTRLLIGGFAVMLLVAAVRTLWVVHQPEPNGDVPWARRAFLGSLVAGGAGFIGGLLGIAGGFIISPMLIWMGYRSKTSAATTAAVATVSSLAGFSGHMAHIAIPGTILLVTLVGASAGSVAGAWFMAHRAKPSWIKALYGIILLTVGGEMMGELWHLNTLGAVVGGFVGIGYLVWHSLAHHEPPMPHVSA